jgi:MFS family permease
MAGYGAIYSYATFADGIAASLAVSQAQLSLIIALGSGTSYFTSALAGALSDRLGPRIPAVLGMLVMGLGLLLASRAQSLPALCLSYGVLVGLGVGLAYVPAVASVQRWFVARRGLASGIAAAGVGIGTALLPSLAGSMIHLGDWRAALLGLGGPVVLVGLAGALLLDAGPERHGLRPDGAGAPSILGFADPGPYGMTLREARGTRRFALLFLGVLLVSVPVSLPFAHLPRFAQDIGMSRPQALLLLGLVGLGSIVGRLLLGVLADHMGRDRVLLGCSAGIGVTTLLWALAGPPVLPSFAFAFGACYGGFVALLPAFVVDLFGSRAAGGIIGLLYTGRGLGALAGPPLLALAASQAGGPAWPLLAAAALGMAGTHILARTAAV